MDEKNSKPSLSPNRINYLLLRRRWWGNRFAYTITLLNISISMSNIWRVPLKLYQYQGSFLIQYIISLFLFAYPVHIFELVLGQYSQIGPISLWDLAPIGRGIGISLCIICIYSSISHQLFIVYSFRYLISFLSPGIPGCSDCDINSILTQQCSPRFCHPKNINSTFSLPAEYYFFNKIVNRKVEGIDDGLGKMIGPNVLLLLIVLLCVSLLTYDSVKSIGMFAPISACMPYTILFILLTASIQILNSNPRNLYQFFTIQMDIFTNVHVWRESIELAFLNLGIAQGTLLAIGSHCDFQNPPERDSFSLCLAHFLTNIISSLIMVFIISTLAEEYQIPIQNILQTDSGILFKLVSEIVIRLQFPYFGGLMLFTFILINYLFYQGILICSIFTAFYDVFPGSYLFKYGINFLFLALIFFSGLAFCSMGGYYLLDLMESMPISLTRIPLVVFELIVLNFIYGYKRFTEELDYVLGYKVHRIILTLWLSVPFFIAIIYILSIVNYEELTILNVSYPNQAILSGLILIFCALLPTGIFPIYWILKCILEKRPDKILKPIDSWGIQD